MLSFKVNMDLLFMKIHYGFMSAGAGPFNIFCPTILRQLGYSAFTIGVIYTTLPIITTLSTVLCSGIADKYKSRRSIFVSSILLMIFNAAIMNYLSEKPLKRNNIHLSCLNETGFSTCGSSMSNNSLNKVLRGLRQNESILCEVNCKSNVKLQYEMCSSWKMEKYCNTVNSKKYRDYDTSIIFSGIVVPQNMYTKTDDLNENFRCLTGEIYTVQLDGESKTYLPRCQKNLSATCDMKCDNDNLNNMINSFFGAFGHYQFWLIFISMIIFFTCITISAVFTDAICFSLLGDRDDLFGKQRVFGALGNGLTGIVAGCLVDYFSEGSFKNYTPMWCLIAGFFIIDLVCISKIKIEQTSVSHSVTKDIVKVLLRGSAIIFVVWCFYAGFVTSIIRNFLYLHLEDLSSPSEKLWIKTLQGTASMISSVPGEMPFFILSGWIIKKIGHVHCMSLILFIMCVRLLAYSFLVRPLWVLPVELLHGVTYGLFVSVMSSCANLIALPGTETTSQGLFYSIFVLGQSSGSLGGGMVYQYYKGSAMFRIFGILTSVLFVLHVLVRFFTRQVQQRNMQEQQLEIKEVKS